MRTTSLSTGLTLLAICLVGLTGCGKRTTSAPAGGGTGSAVAHSHDHGHGHSHGHSHEHDHGHAHGPHDGHVIELGTEDYHAELTHDEASQRVGIYLLGADAATAATTEAATVTIHVSVDGQPTQYTLPAVPQPGETAGKSSYFELTSEPLQTIVSGNSPSPETQARISITIDGLPYVGVIDPQIDGHDHLALHSHSPGEDDALVWRKEISEQGYEIALGHHGTSLLAGGDVEPAVQITRAGQPVAGARVFNALLAADGQTALTEEVATVYESPTSDEPAHYAQGGLKIPAGTRQAVIRYRIVLPENKGEHTFDLPVDVK